MKKKVYSVIFKEGNKLQERFFKHLYQAKRYIHIMYMSDDNIKLSDFKLKVKKVTEKDYYSMVFFY